MGNEENTNDVLFESEFIHTKNAVKRYLGIMFKPIFIGYIILPFFAIAMGTVLFICYDDVILLAMGIILAICFPPLAFLLYQKNCKIIYARFLEQNHGREVIDILQFSNVILITNKLTGNKFAYSYSCIKRIIDKKDIIILLTAAKLMIIVDKTKFTVGNLNEFIPFIKSKTGIR